MDFGLGLALGLGSTLLGGLLGGGDAPETSSYFIPKPQGYANLARYYQGILTKMLNDMLDIQAPIPGDNSTPIGDQPQPMPRITSSRLPQLRDNIKTAFDVLVSGTPYFDASQLKAWENLPTVDVLGMKIPVYGVGRARARMLNEALGLMANQLALDQQQKERYLKNVLTPIDVMNFLFQIPLSYSREAEFPISAGVVQYPSMSTTLGGLLSGFGQGLLQYTLMNNLLRGIGG
ncbi:hypothetical protein Hydth_0554 [Hydrogenobacter thermophilus TK-6]|uniref:Uncharacterized protein n=2 Tax=Hydrogenobacter thermophilus TaxID=940 RepID=D3DGR6_HYDTT|nr:hypothetical protein Hydth_0554 [Hydrogenobacter thermophilus TK-6]BAI69018.1 hypothetical protein HTH_0556 [Hydrogenobacter thermophilus TK-6]